jgi:ribonucleoside-diphosphate reductase alpha chain
MYFVQLRIAADIFEFLDLKKNHGKEELRARDLFYALWISDLFMERVKSDADWSLFCPNESPGLFDVYGEKFEALYHQYEQEGRARKTVKARDLWTAVLESQIETGTPYILYKDAADQKRVLSRIWELSVRPTSARRLSNILLPTTVAVCNLASLALPKYVVNGRFDFDKLSVRR